MQNHRRLDAWRRARQLSLLVTRLRMQGWRPALAPAWDQLHRSALSIQLNIAEGYAFGASPRLTFHLRVAHASAVEVLELVELLAEVEGIDAPSQEQLTCLAVSTAQLVTGLLRHYRPRPRA